jgi:hypothetical protein
VYAGLGIVLDEQRRSVADRPCDSGEADLNAVSAMTITGRELLVSCANLVRRPGVLLGLGVVAIAVYNLVPAAIPQSIVHEGLGTIAAVSVALRARRCRDGSRVGFALIAVGIGCWVSGDVASDVMRFTSADASIPYPSIADVMYLLGYGIALGRPRSWRATCSAGRRWSR